VVVPVFAGKGMLGSFLASDVILLGRQSLAPIRVVSVELVVDVFGHVDLDARERRTASPRPAGLTSRLP
jgi:hypothetical protein